MIAPPHRASSRSTPASPLQEGTIFGVVLASASGRVLHTNEAFLKLVEYDSLEALNKKGFANGLLKSPSEWMAWADVARGSGGQDVRVEMIRASGGSVRLRGRIERAPLLDGQEPAVRAILVDDSATARLHELALRTARIESLLQISAGATHDFNNLLTVLVGNLYLLAEQLRDQPALHEKVRKARDAAKRGAVIARQILDVSRDSAAHSDASAVDVGRVLETLAPLLAAGIGARIALRREVAPDTPPAFVSRAQLESVITNLVINARDALAGRADGAIAVSVRRRELATAAERPPLRAGSYAEISVEDNGCGIPPDLAERVFEPFFSTKQRSQGSGLGLPMVCWFAEKAGGAVSLKSEPNRGTTVTVLLPAHHAETVETAVHTMPLSALPNGNETVLVLTNDPDLRLTVEQILGALGYRVRAVDSAPTLSAEGETAAVAIVDAQALTSASTDWIREFVGRPHKAVGLVVIGDSRTKWPTCARRVPKPFTLLELANAVRAAIDGG